MPEPLGQDRPRLVVVEQVMLKAPADPYLDLRSLEQYSNLSVRKLRDCLLDGGHPLPFYRVGGKILVRRSEFDAWIAVYRHKAAAEVDGIVDDVLESLRGA